MLCWDTGSITPYKHILILIDMSDISMKLKKRCSMISRLKDQDELIPLENPDQIQNNDSILMQPGCTELCFECGSLYNKVEEAQHMQSHHMVLKEIEGAYL